MATSESADKLLKLLTGICQNISTLLRVLRYE